MYNKTTLIGNVTADAKAKTFDNGDKVVNFNLAENIRGFKTKDGREVEGKTQFHNIVVKTPALATFCEQYIKKGALIVVDGSINYRDYTDKNGQKMKITEIVAREIKLLPRRTAEQEQGEKVEDLPF